MLTPSSIDHQENIFPFFFHQVTFPGKFLQFGRVGGDFPEEGGIFPDLITVKFPLFLEFLKPGFQSSPSEDIVAVEKYHPTQKNQGGNKVLIQQKTQYFHPIDFLSGIDKFLSVT